jgi:hypothetical protein
VLNTWVDVYSAWPIATIRAAFARWT